MIEAGFKQVRGTGVARDVPAQLAVSRIGTRHHGQCVPAHQRRQLFLNGQVAGEHGLAVHGDGVDVGRDQFGLPADVRTCGHLRQLVQNKARARRAVRGNKREKSIAPFGGFCGVDVAVVGGQESGEAVVGHTRHCRQRRAKEVIENGSHAPSVGIKSRQTQNFQLKLPSIAAPGRNPQPAPPPTERLHDRHQRAAASGHSHCPAASSHAARRWFRSAAGCPNGRAR